MLPIINAREVRTPAADPAPAEAMAAAGEIVERVRRGGAAAAREYAERFGEISAGPLVIGREEIARRSAGVSAEDAALLRRTAERITAFARAQRGALSDLSVDVPGGRAGHTFAPVASAGCYAPGGRYPLPSSVLMTACVARAAGVRRVVVASPRPAAITYAAAAAAGADEMLVIGGAQAVAMLAFGGDGLAPVDLIAGPGNKFVTAAKKLVLGTVGIDMLAGPSELAVLEDGLGEGAAEVIAADLLAQAEHDDDARPMLVTTSAGVAGAVREGVLRRIELLPEPNRSTARRACERGFIAVAGGIEEAIAAVDVLAPEHLEVFTPDPAATAARCRNAGAVFLGPGSAEVFGDYGAGPNHTLPTGGSARFAAGLSVLTFLRARTWLEVRPEPGLVEDTARLARLEGLEAHARAAEARRGGR